MTKTITRFCTALTLLSLPASPLFSQTFDYGYAFGSSGSDRGTAVTNDAAGNVYTVGSFRDTVDFDPGTGVANLVSEQASNR